MARLPARGPAVRELGLALPPDRMPLFRRMRPLKRWRYVGLYGPELMLCVGDARVGALPTRWWAIALPDGTLHERTTVGRGGVRLEEGLVEVEARGVRLRLELEESEGVETASESGAGYIWTSKQGGVPARGRLELDGESRQLEGDAVIDHSAGYHERHTVWRWSAGVGRADSGQRVAWNLVTGVHDAPTGSERTVWVDGEPREADPVEFAEDLSAITCTDGAMLRFSEWSAREDHTNLLLFRSDYRQPFGVFEGTLPGGIRLAEGWGVMEDHDVRW